MRSNTYVFIDAHIIRCRLHHHNNLKYSVALKSGKDQQVTTGYQPSKDLIIEMDTHLALQADKHSYDNFPKLTLIVNVMNDSGERKTVGTTFANFRKEGVQIFQVSECSCKDKAFEVEMSFSLKLVELKGSKSSHNKNPLAINKKANYFSQQPTPKDSREIKQDRLVKQVKAQSRGDSQQRIQKLNKIHSQKILSNVQSNEKNTKCEERPILQLMKQIQFLTQKIRIQELQLAELGGFQQEILTCRQKNNLLSELLQIQEEKNHEAMSYISKLQHSILGFLPKQHHKQSVASFKVIQQLDEIVQMNRQLQSDLQAQRQKNCLLELELEHLKQQLKKIIEKQQQTHKLEAFQEISFINLNKQLPGPSISSHQILITSICKKKVESSIIIQQKQNIEELTTEVASLTSKVETLRLQIEKLQAIKKQLENNPYKKNVQKKPSPAKLQPAKRLIKPQRNQKGTSKDKNWKPPKTIKKTSINSPSSKQTQGKESEGGLAKSSLQLSPVTKIVKLASTEIQSKTERQFSIEKSSDLSLLQKSQRKMKIYNETVYFTDGFQN